MPSVGASGVLESAHVVRMRTRITEEANARGRRGKQLKGFDQDVHSFVGRQLSEIADSQRRSWLAFDMGHSADLDSVPRHVDAVRRNAGERDLISKEARRRENDVRMTQRIDQHLVSRLEGPNRKPLAGERLDGRASTETTGDVAQAVTGQLIRNAIPALLGGNAPRAFGRALGTRTRLAAWVNHGDPGTDEPEIVQGHDGRNPACASGGENRRPEEIAAVKMQDVRRSSFEQPLNRVFEAGQLIGGGKRLIETLRVEMNPMNGYP